MPNDLFDQTGDNLTTLSIDPSKDYLTELVGDGKKFKDTAELAKGKAYSDAHILQLENTLTGLRQELAQRSTVDDLMNRINLLNTKAPMPPPQENNQHQQGEVKPGLSIEDVNRLLADRDAQSQRAFNLNSATQKLRDQFGDQAATIVDQKAKELGLSKDYMKTIAEAQPSVFLALFNGASAPTKETFNAPSPSSYRPPTDKPALTDSWKKFNEIKKADPNLYWSPAFQRKVMEAANKASEEGRYDEFMAS